MEIFFVVGFWLLCGIGAAMIAQSKGRSGFGWFIAGVLFGPLALLTVGFMAPGRPATEVSPAAEMVLYSEGKVRVTNQRLLIENRSFAIKNLQTVTVVNTRANRWEIALKNLSGETIYTLDSDNQERIQRIAKAINEGIMAPVGITSIGSTTNAQSSTSIKSNTEILAELKKMLDAGLITEDEFNKKKAEILSKM